MKEFKIRASATGNLMTSSRSKTESLSQTTKTYLEEWAKEQIYGVKKDIHTKAMDRGTEKENFSIDKAIEWLDLPFLMKNEEYFENDYICGTPDLLLPNKVIDIKTSWDCWTFPLFKKEIPNKDYYYQLQAYMELTGKKEALLCYILLNTPENYNTGEISYDHVDKKYRIKTFEFKYDADVILEVNNRVIEAREYINAIISEL